jgi:hypothetical protein
LPLSFLVVGRTDNRCAEVSGNDVSRSSCVAANVILSGDGRPLLSDLGGPGTSRASELYQL